jgi:hypothetical protein
MALENIPSITGANDIVETDPNLMPIYQVQSQDPGLATGELQKLYGTAAMPMFQWAKRIQTGEATFDPANQFDREAADFIASASDADLEAQGLDVSVKDTLAQAGGFAAQAVVSKAGLQAATEAGLTGFGSAPVSSGQFTSQLMPAAKSYLPEFAGGPSGLQVFSGTDPAIAAQFGLQPGQTAISKASFQALKGMKGGEFLGGTSIGNTGGMAVQTNALKQIAGDKAGQMAIASQAPDPGMFESGGFFDKGTTRYTPSLSQIGMNFGIGLGVNLLMGQKPLEAAKNAAITTAGTAIGTAVGGPIGGFIGGTLAGIVGGRVICNELVRQGFMNRNQIILDYKFTRDHLSPQHVKGYHAWAIHIVRRLRKGKGVKMWRHIATHRVNEIAYIYGERDKPDYLGKIYRHVGEKGCWLVGLFCEKSDWSVLYKTKEA